MKKLITTLLFTAFNLLAFAQSADETAVKKVLIEERKAFHAGDKEALQNFWKNDPKTFVLFSGTDGGFFYMDNEKAQKFFATVKPNDQAVGTITSSKVQVSGNNAVANLEMTVVQKNGTSFKQHCIVLLDKEGNAWKVTGYSVHVIPTDKKEEEEAIKKMLDEEKKASDAADFKIYKSHWVQAPYVSFQYNGLSFVGDAFWKKAEEIFASRKPINIITTRTDWNFSIKGAAAFVTFSQKSENVEKKTTDETYEERYVEKVNGEWKMVNMTAIKKAN